jgi:proline iminopeptidase
MNNDKILAIPHNLEEIAPNRPLYPITPPRHTGNLQVSDLHTLYYSLYGDPNGIPVVVLHGGPGAGCTEFMTRYFDLSKWNLILFDQRGAVRSKPFACMEENTTQDLVEDIEKLRKHLGVDQWLIFGGSWGSTLGLVYGQAYPERCLGFILRGLFLGRSDDHLHLIYGMGRHFPEAYESVVQFIPENERSDLFEAYYCRILDPDPQIHLPAAKAFMRFDLICSTMTPDPARLETLLQNEAMVLSTAKSFFHYAKHNFFLEQGQILANMNRIAHLPAILVQGRWDLICPPDMAHAVYQAWPNATLWMVSNGGHSGLDPSIASALTQATEKFILSIKRIPSIM